MARPPLPKPFRREASTAKVATFDKTDSIEVGLDRNEDYRPGIEVQGAMFLPSSDGRGPVLVDAKTGLTPWGNREFALAVFAP